MKKKFKLMLGDNIESLKKLPDNSIDSIVSDPPYGLSFMGKKWDYDVPSVEFWKEVYRVLKPGGHVLSFGGTRTYHRMVVNIEDAGFEIRDQIMWLYGSGFPKSLNVGKAVDKLQGNKRDVVGKNPNHRKTAGLLELGFQDGKESSTITKGTSPWEGWGTALKPANEPICVARKPLSEKSVAENVLKWGTGGINIDGCRIDSINNEHHRPGVVKKAGNFQNGVDKEWMPTNAEGRFPANIILECICDELEDGPTIKGNENYKWSNTEGNGEVFKGRGKYTPRTDEVKIHTDPNCPCYQLDKQTGYLKSGVVKPHHKKNKTANGYQGSCYGKFKNEDTSLSGYGDGGGASRFFYVAKVSKKERNMGLDGFEEKESQQKGHGLDRICMNEGCGVSMLKPELCKCEEPDWRPRPKKNSHPTVKPVQLMAYLCRLITPPNGIVLDPFMGSGSTGISALLEGFRFVGMEMDENYFKIAEARIENYEKYREFVEKKKK